MGDVTELLSSNLGGGSGSCCGEGEAISSADSSWGVPAGWEVFERSSRDISQSITVPGSEGGELGRWHGEVWKVGTYGESIGS